MRSFYQSNVLNVLLQLDRAYDQVIFPLENFRKEHIGGVKVSVTSSPLRSLAQYELCHCVTNTSDLMFTTIVLVTKNKQKGSETMIFVSLILSIKLFWVAAAFLNPIAPSRPNYTRLDGGFKFVKQDCRVDV